ncbi:hypothetical protein BJ741DRAFT_593395 [Chytriomyces cf. hyalinus JEL632]|nr:hypothetical protein BJ741DRAFT_593395 [Chytriomyces cf. hyalinus JEL632]
MLRVDTWVPLFQSASLLPFLFLQCWQAHGTYTAKLVGGHLVLRCGCMRYTGTATACRDCFHFNPHELRFNQTMTLPGVTCRFRKLTRSYLENGGTCSS